MAQNSMNMNQSRSATEPYVHSMRSVKKAAVARHQGARLNYERYLAQARTQALIGNQIEAENFYQHCRTLFPVVQPVRKLPEIDRVIFGPEPTG